MNIVEIRNLEKIYPSFHLRDVSFSIQPGRITGFIGRNGAGKTTTIKSMLNLVHPDGGEIVFFGLPFPKHEADIKKRIGYSTGTVSWYPRKKISSAASTRPGITRLTASIFVCSTWTKTRLPWNSPKA